MDEVTIELRGGLHLQTDNIVKSEKGVSICGRNAEGIANAQISCVVGGRFRRIWERFLPSIEGRTEGGELDVEKKIFSRMLDPCPVDAGAFSECGQFVA